MISDSQKSKLKIGDIPVVQESFDVFSNELSRLPPNREIEFKIEVQSGINPISIPRYRIALEELKR